MSSMGITLKYEQFVRETESKLLLKINTKHGLMDVWFKKSESIYNESNMEITISKDIARAKNLIA